MKEKKRILNDDIKASLVKLIDEEGEIIGEMSLSDAKILAKKDDLDLMQLWKEGNMVIVKMLDYGKFLYRQKKQDQKNKQKWKAPDLKIIKITFKIGDHDLEVKRNQAQKFAKDGNPLKVMLTLRGRENHYEDIAREKMQTFLWLIEEYYKVDKPVIKAGNNFFSMLSPK